MFRLIRAAFNQRRKTLANAISNAADLDISREQVARALEKMGKTAALRGEAMTLEEFSALADLLKTG